jgi:hypothetical protein
MIRQQIRVYDGPFGSGSHIAWIEAWDKVDEERLARAICDYAGGRQRLVFPMSKVRIVAHRLAELYCLDEGEKAAQG